MACGDVTGGNGSDEPRLDFVGGIPPADTINGGGEATVLVALQTAGGSPLPDQRVVFEGPGDELAGVAQVFVATLEGNWGGPVTDTTDANGRAGVLVYRSAAAGTAWLRVRAPALGLSDSLPFEILPGRPAEIRLTPVDTAVLVGGGFPIVARVVDRFGNTRAEAVTLAADSASLSVNGAPGAGTVTGVALGRGSVRADGAGLTARAWVSVVPAGTLAFFIRAYDTDDSIAIVTVSTDGSGYRELFTSPFDYGSDRPLDWAPDGQSLVFHYGTNSQPFRLYHIALDGSIRRVIAQDIGGYPELHPRYGWDGWIYFTAQTDWSIGTDELWRVRPDGSSAMRIGLPAAPYETDTYAAPAPDGLRVWFSTDRLNPGPEVQELASLRLDSGTVNYLGFYGIGAVWSPQGDRVAFLDRAGAIIVAAPDGSAQRVVSPGTRTYVPNLDWSPDGRWIVAAGVDGTDITDADSGLTLPLAFASRWRHPSWRP
jgi:hypothetical protein